MFGIVLESLVLVSILVFLAHSTGLNPGIYVLLPGISWDLLGSPEIFVLPPGLEVPGLSPGILPG